jgi:GDP-4-dehydro-6-deoxy-D-mannose reductase
MKAFITGITGMAGSFLAEHLLACGDEVRGSSRRGQWPPYVPSELASAARLFPWDCAQALPRDHQEALSRFAPDCIFHLAALSVPADCGWPNPTPLARAVNVDGVAAVCELARQLPSSPRVVLISSCHVYGAMDAKHSVVSEDAPSRPEGGYGKSKLAAEQVLRDRSENCGIDGVIARAFHHTGPRQLPRLMVPQWARQLVAPGDEPLRVLTLDAHLDLCDVRDVVRAYRLLGLRRSDAQDVDVFNVGSGQSVRSGDVLDRLCGLCESRREVIETSPGVRHNPIADASRIRRETDWRPEIPLEQTLRDTLEFWRGRPFG